MQRKLRVQCCLVRELLVLSDEDITSKSTQFFDLIISFFDRLFSPKVEEIKIGRYENDRNKFLYRGPCGPAALAWMYHANYGSNKYSHFESYASTFGGLGVFWIFGKITGTKPMSPLEMTMSYLAASGWKTYISPSMRFGSDNAHTHMKWHDDPIVILTTSGGELHWMIGWGAKREKNWYFWDKHWFHINDNGAKNGSSSGGYYFMKASWPFGFLKVWE